MRRFIEESGNAPRHAKILRDKLAARGYVLVQEDKRRIATDISIELTPKGRKLASYATMIAELARE